VQILKSRSSCPSTVKHESGGFHHRGTYRGHSRWLASGSCARRRRADPVAGAAEGVDFLGRGHRSAGAGPRSGEEGARGRAVQRRGARTRARAQRSAGNPAQGGVRGRASDRDRQAGRAGRPSSGGQSGRDAGQCAAPPLPRLALGHRRRRAAGH
ncbi:hypothetical protein QU38_01955, partial [Staphylococcus aureus]